MMSIVATILISLASAFVYPSYLWIRARWRARKNLAMLLRSKEDWLAIAGSTTPPPDLNFREPDSSVAIQISRFAGVDLQGGTHPYSFVKPTQNLVILGSTRYNELARSLQRIADLPYQYVHTKTDKSAVDLELVVVTKYGEEFRSSRDLRASPGEEDIDYALILVGSLPNKKRLLWLSGIHGAGTKGALKFLEQNAEEILRRWPNREYKLVSWLLRVEYTTVSAEEPRYRIDNVEALGEHQTGQLMAKQLRTAQNSAVVCDLGNVLLYFNRERTYRSVAHALGRKSHEIQNLIERSNLRTVYEKGKLDDDTFIAQLYELLGVDEKELPRRFLEEFWSDIFWLNGDFSRMLQQLSKQGTVLYLLSNTSRLHYGRVASDFPDIFNLFEKAVLSYEVGAAKPDDRMYREIEMLVSSRKQQIATSRSFFIDDSPENVNAAIRHNFQATIYRSYSQIVTWLRKRELYVD